MNSTPTARCIGLSCLVAASSLLIAGTAASQNYPNRSIRMIVPTAPGGGSDFIARTLNDKLIPALGQQVVVDNRAGAGGNIGAELAAKASPDGYTVIVVTSSHASNISLYKKLNYHPTKDFTAITQLAANAFLVCVTQTSTAKTLKELVSLAQSRQGKFSYASAGPGQGAHLGMELFRTMAGFEATHVPYNGIAPAAVSLLGGQVDIAMLTPPVSLPHVKSGRLRLLAVTTMKRTVFLPDTPTVAEQGYPGFELNNWTGLVAPAGTPKPVVMKLYEEIARVLRNQEVVDRLATLNTEPVGSTPDEFAAFIEAEIVKWGRVIRQSGASAD